MCIQSEFLKAFMELKSLDVFNLDFFFEITRTITIGLPGQYMCGSDYLLLLWEITTSHNPGRKFPTHAHKMCMGDLNLSPLIWKGDALPALPRGDVLFNIDF